MRSSMAPKVLAVQNQQFSRSLDRILEEAFLSGELNLMGRKLKDFPKLAAGPSTTQFNLEDTVFADLSRNRFTELPDEITGFIFLETLLLNQNVLRTIPDSVRSLSSLSFLDLRNNQLTSLPRELCSLPLKILLVSNNRLTQLPDELGRMDKLTELDASCNQIAHLPNRMMELRALRALFLRNNHLIYIPREVTNLQLVTLDISGNRIGKLPTELRQMESLVNLELGDNPLTFPPANLCVRGIVHVFKYLETVANKDDKRAGLPSGLSVDATLRRNVSNPTQSLKLNGNNNSINLLIENQQRKKQMMMDGGGGSLEHIDKQRWSSQEDRLSSPKWSPMHAKAPPIVESPMNGNHSDLSPGEEKPGAANDPRASVSNVQTYKEYKEALKQQRNQDSTAVYRSKDNSSGSSSSGGSNQASPLTPVSENGKADEGYDDIVIMNKPKLPPPSAKSVMGGKDSSQSEMENSKNNNNGATGGGYVKPASPFGSSNKTGGGGDSTDSMIIKSIMNGNLKNTGKEGDNNGGKSGGIAAKNNKRTVSWNRDIVTSEKNISFTMRREFDRHKEEAELIGKLRNILESRLKMTLPQDMAPSLSDGVVLCHLANNVRPRSVASIHVPSPAVPKLTMARCRRNVDNFLEACRKIGVDDESLISGEAILSLEKDIDGKEEVGGAKQEDDSEEDENETTKRLETLKALTDTVMSMIECSSRSSKRLIAASKKPSSGFTFWTPKADVESTAKAPATNNKALNKSHKNSILNNNKMEEERLDEEFQDENSYENYVNYFKRQGILFPRSTFSSPAKKALEKTGGGCEKNVIYQRDNKQRMELKLALTGELVGGGGLVRDTQGIKGAVVGEDGDLIEDCEYDSDNGMFNCSDDGAVEDWAVGNTQGRATKPKREIGVMAKTGVNKNNELSLEQQKGSMNKKIEYFENKLKPSKADNRLKEALAQNRGRGGGYANEVQGDDQDVERSTDQKRMINILCLGSFFGTMLLLYLFPLPN